MSGANASPTGRSHQEMTAHNPSVRFDVDDRACAVIDRAYNHLVVLRTVFLFSGTDKNTFCDPARITETLPHIYCRVMTSMIGQTYSPRVIGRETAFPNTAIAREVCHVESV
jgi:hypothetical protein